MVFVFIQLVSNHILERLLIYNNFDNKKNITTLFLKLRVNFGESVNTMHVNILLVLL